MRVLGKEIYMFQRDYIQRMIEEAGDFVARLVGLRQANRFEELEKNLDIAFDSWFPFDRSVLLTIAPEDLPGYLVETAQLGHEHMTVLADLLREEAEYWFTVGKWDKGKHLLQGGLKILQYLNEAESDIFSFPRHEKIQGITLRLTQLADDPGAEESG